MADEKKLKHFCHIERFENWLQGLSDKQKSLVIDMGAGFVFSLKSKMRLDDCLTKYLVHIFDWKKEALEVEEGNFLYIKSLIKDLYDLPNTGDKVPSRTRKTAISGDLKTKFSWLFNCRVGKLWEQAKAATSDDEFSVLFMLALLNMFLAPSGSVVDVSFLDDLIDHQKIKGFDWCTFIADCLVTGIYKYKEGELPHVCGCLHILHLIYADYVKCTDTKAPPAGVPRSAHITDADLEYAAKKAASVSLKKKSSSSTDVESMDSSPQNCRLNYRKPKAPASGLGTAVDLINIRQSALFKGVSDLEEYYGGSSYETGTEISGPVETSGGNGSLRTTGEDKKKRASWTTAQLDLLVSVMKEYADAARFRGQNGWTKEGWNSMTTRLNNQFPRANFIVCQLKFREQRLKKEYFVVKSIVEKSGFGFDPITKMPTTIDEKWDELSKEQQKWRYKAFPYYKAS